MAVQYIIAMEFHEPVEHCALCPFAVDYDVDNFGVSEVETRCVFSNEETPWIGGKRKDCPLVTIEDYFSGLREVEEKIKKEA